MLGSTQPGRISEYLLQAIRGGRGDDGLIQRFGLLVWPDISGEWKHVDRWLRWQCRDPELCNITDPSLPDFLHQQPSTPTMVESPPTATAADDQIVLVIRRTPSAITPKAPALALTSADRERARVRANWAPRPQLVARRTVGAIRGARWFHFADTNRIILGTDMTEETRPPWFDEYLDAEHERRPPKITPAQIVMGDALMIAKIFDMLETGQARFREKYGRSPTRTELQDFVLSDDEIQWRMRQ
jgi:hypothetical protein